MFDHIGFPARDAVKSRAPTRLLLRRHIAAA
jgi:hypothetical protein